MTKTKKFLSSVFFFLLLGFAPSCELIEELTGEAIDSFFISSVLSESNPTITGKLIIDGVEETIINIFNFSASESSVNFTIENEGFIGLSFLVPSKNGTFNIQQDVSIDEDAIRILADGSFSYFKSGSGTVSSFTKDILDSSRGKISFKLKGSGKFGGDDPRFGDRDIDFDLTVNFDNRNDPPYTPPVVVDNGDGSGSGGSTVSYCTTTYQGPSGAPQRDGFCQAAWVYLCKNGLSPDSKEVKEYCRLYAQMNQITTPMVNCPYCR